MPPWDGFNNSIIANRQKDTFVHGFLDVSGRAFIRNGNLVVGYDSSLNGNVSIGNDLTIVGRLNVRQYSSQNIINTTTTNYQLIVSEDLSLNGRLFTSGNVVVGGNLIITDTTYSSTNTLSPNNTIATSTTNSWTKDNIVWGSSASSSQTSSFYHPFTAFLTNLAGNNDTANTGWIAATTSYSASTYTYNTTTYSTIMLNNVGAKNGEWLQISSNVPLILNKFFLTTIYYNQGSNQTVRLPYSYYICGSTDGSTWYPIIYVTAWSVLPVTNGTGAAGTGLFTNTYTIPSGTTTGGTLQGDTITGPTTPVNITYNTYGNSKNAYSYFRIVVETIIGNRFGLTSALNPTYTGFCWRPTFTYPENNSISFKNGITNINNSGLIINNGFIGIGKTNPNVPLYVVGGIQNNSATSVATTPHTTSAVLRIDNIVPLGSAAGNLVNLLHLTTNSGGSLTQLSIYNYRHAAGSDWYSSSMRMHYTIDSTNFSYLEFNPYGQNGIGLYTYGTGSANLNSATNGITIKSDGTVGIGNTNPATTLDVNGGFFCSHFVSNHPDFNFRSSIFRYGWDNRYNIRVDGTNFYVSLTASDYRIKQNFRNPINVLQRLNNLKMFEYQYKNHGAIQNDESYFIGFFAHELQDLFPEYDTIVYGKKDGYQSDNNEIEIQQINSFLFSNILLKAIQEQQHMIENQQTIIESQQNEIQDLKNQIQAILSRLDNANIA